MPNKSRQSIAGEKHKKKMGEVKKAPRGVIPRAVQSLTVPLAKGLVNAFTPKMPTSKEKK